MTEDLLTYSEENLLAQLASAPYERGFFTVTFYADGQHKPSRERTKTVEEFYLYPSGGTLRDKEYNLVWYAARFDTSHGWIPPGGPWKNAQDKSAGE